MSEADDRAAAQAWARALLSRDDWLILDTETTGLGIWAEVVQLAVIDKAGQPLLDTLVKPTRAIEPGAQRIHGISAAKVVDAPGFTDVYTDLCAVLQGKTVVVYNADFDLNMLYQSMHLSMGVDRPREVAPLRFGAAGWDCAMLQYAAFCGDWSDYHGNYRYQKLPGGDHTALGDCRATLALIKRMAGVCNAAVVVPVMDQELEGYRAHYAGRRDAYPLADVLSSFVADLVGSYTDRAGSNERQRLAYAYTDRWRRDRGWTSGLPNDTAMFTALRLNDAEQKSLALALQGLAMRQGPGVFGVVHALALELGIGPELEAALKDWVAYAQTTTTTE